MVYKRSVTVQRHRHSGNLKLSSVHGGPSLEIMLASWRLYPGSGRLYSGSWRLYSGSWRIHCGSWRLYADLGGHMLQGRFKRGNNESKHYPLYILQTNISILIGCIFKTKIRNVMKWQLQKNISEGVLPLQVLCEVDGFCPGEI